MKFSDESYNLRIELDTKGCELTPAEIEDMETTLDTLRNVVERFPVSNLYITIVRYPRTGDFHVKTSLALPGKTLFIGDRDDGAQPAFDRCVRKLVKKVTSYIARMQGTSEIAKHTGGTHHVVAPTDQLNLEEIQAAIDDDDYLRFRKALMPFEEPMRKRIGRWLQRYPQIEAQLGGDFKIADIVEEVFLNAFEQFPKRVADVPPGNWLESLIDPSVQAILESPSQEFENISFVRTMREVESP